MDLKKYEIFYEKLQKAYDDLNGTEILLMETAKINHQHNGCYFIRVTSNKYDLSDFVDTEKRITLLKRYDIALESLKAKGIINDYTKEKIIGLSHPEVGYLIYLK